MASSLTCLVFQLRGRNNWGLARHLSLSLSSGLSIWVVWGSSQHSNLGVDGVFTWQLVSPRECTRRVPGRSYKAFYNLALEVTKCHFPTAFYWLKVIYRASPEDREGTIKKGMDTGTLVSLEDNL